MCPYRVLFVLIFCPSVVYLCNYQLNNSSGTIILPSYDNNIECIWLFNLSSIPDSLSFRGLLLTFRYFDTEFGHDELFIGETLTDVSKYNSKLFRFSGSKLPDPCWIPLRGNTPTQSIWIQFTSDQSNPGSGFVLDYVFSVNQSTTITSKSPQILIDEKIRHPLGKKLKKSKVSYPYPSGTISSPNYPQNYSNNIICRWHFYQRNAFIRLHINRFDTELHYDTLTLYLGQNINNRAMILYQWSGDQIEKKDLIIANDILLLIFNTDQTNNASGFSLQYEIIEKEIRTFEIYNTYGTIHSKDYPTFIRTNLEHTWIIHMNNSNEIQINLLDIHLDFDHDYLQISTGEMIYSLNTPESVRLQTTNETKLFLRTRHLTDDDQYRGFNLTYRIWNRTITETNQLRNLPCEKRYSSPNGTIEFHMDIITSLDCLIFIEVDDGQNIFLRFDSLNWDTKENYLEIGLLHDPNQYQIFHISDTLPGLWFIANDSQLWIRFHSSHFSMGLCTFRLSYSETIQWSTVLPAPYVQVLDRTKLFPYRLSSLPTHSIYQNLTQAYVWHIEALEDECLTITFKSFQAIEDRRICFRIKESLKTTEICTHEQFPLVYYHVGSCALSIEPEFLWMLVKYDIRIEKFKKVTTINEMTFNGNSMVLTLPMSLDPFIQIEWLILMNSSSRIIFDIENLDGNTPAELILPQNDNTTESYLLETIASTRFCTLLYSASPSFRIIYKSFSSPSQKTQRLFHLNLYKISKSYFSLRDFHYISYETNQSISQWTIRGQYETSTFSAKLFSSNPNLSLQTTANINLSSDNSSISVPSSDFDIRHKSPNRSKNTDFIIILYEQPEKNSDQTIVLNKPSDIIETNDHIGNYTIRIQSNVFQSIDFLLIKADNGTMIRLYDLNDSKRTYFLFNSSLITTTTKGLTSPIGLRFSVKSLNLRIELQSITKTPIQLRYKAVRLTSIENDHSSLCLITDINRCENNTHSQTCNESCSKWFDHIASSMINHNLRMPHFWPYALRGSVTLIIENTTVENFERTIYRNLRQCLAKIIRQFCLKSPHNCLSEDAEALRSDHVIIQSYEEQLDDQRLYVAIFIKDPYRQKIALTHDQLLLALQRNDHEIYQDIKHHINLPSNILEKNLLDPIWLYGVCLLALLVLIIVILMLITILVKRTSRSPNRNERIKKTERNSTAKRDSLLISSPIHLASDEDEPNCSSCYNETESSQTSNSAGITTLPSATSCYQYPIVRTSYFNSAIEAAVKQRLDDDEPIPFIDDNLSTTHSRKSSACWSDKTSLSSRFGFAWKMNRMRSGAQANGKEKRRYHQRTIRYTIPPAQQNQPNEQL